MSRLLALVCLVSAALAAGCGGDDDLSGEASVPDGYTVFKGAGVSFAHPEGWRVEQRDAGDGTVIEIAPQDRTETPYAQIRLAVSEGAGDRFDTLADQRRVVIREVNGGEIESDEEVELDGADKALRAKTKTPPGRGSDPVEVRSESLDVLRENGDVLTLVAAAPQREGQELDPAAVVSSFRLEGS